MATAEECVWPEDREAHGVLVAIADPHELAIGSRREDAGVGGHIELAVRWVEPDPVEVDHLLSGHSTRSEEHTSELQSQMRTSYAVFCLKKKTQQHPTDQVHHTAN